MRLIKFIGGIVVFVWLLGFILNFGGNLIHLLLIVAAVLFLWDKIFK